MNSLVKLATNQSKPDYAEGLPNRSDYGDLSKIKPEDILTFLVQQHLAKRAGEHYDVRLGSPELGLLSWAVRKGLPLPGGKAHLAVRQPVHKMSYKDFEGTIPEGYGAGEVKKMLESAAVIHKASENHILFTLGDERGGNRYSLVNTDGKNWLLKNVTPASAPLTKEELKPKLKNIDAQSDKDKIKDMLVNKVLSPKLDGALTTIKVGKTLEAYSPRTRAGSGLPITYSERLGLVGKPVDQSLKDMILRGEVIAQQGGKILDPSAISGLLNMNLASMLDKLRKDKIDLKVGLFDVGGKGTPLDKQKLLSDILNKLPKDKFFNIPKYTGAEAESVYDQILRGNNPLTKEGVVLEDIAGQGPSQKIKFLNESDVVINDIFKALTQPGKPERAGGFSYTTPDKSSTGKVGTGFSHDMLKDMLANPDKYIGRTARVRSLDKYPSGSLRAPAFLALHEDY